MLAGVDGDILPYEIGAIAEYGDTGIKSWDYVKEIVDQRIAGICYDVDSEEPPVIFLTGTGNFREEIAKKKGYKETRKDKEKPFHWKNIRAYLIFRYGATVVNGMEADDALAIWQTDNIENGVESTICSRDKDLRMIPGRHFSWECGKNQPAIGPYEVDEMGEFWTKKLPKELKGTGMSFFYAQCLMGDGVDNIPGLPGCGPVKAYNALKDAVTAEEMEAIVLGMYEEKYAENALQELTEQGQLLYMIRRLDEEGNPVMWRPSVDT